MSTIVVSDRVVVQLLGLSGQLARCSPASCELVATFNFTSNINFSLSFSSSIKWSLYTKSKYKIGVHFFVLSCQLEDVKGGGLDTEDRTEEEEGDRTEEDRKRLNHKIGSTKGSTR